MGTRACAEPEDGSSLRGSTTLANTANVIDMGFSDCRCDCGGFPWGANAHAPSMGRPRLVGHKTCSVTDGNPASMYTRPLNLVGSSSKYPTTTTQPCTNATTTRYVGGSEPSAAYEHFQNAISRDGFFNLWYFDRCGRVELARDEALNSKLVGQACCAPPKHVDIALLPVCHGRHEAYRIKKPRSHESSARQAAGPPPYFRGVDTQHSIRRLRRTRYG